MKFPRKASAGADAQADALERLEEARDEQREMGDRRAAARAGPAEEHLSTELKAASEQVAAREAWAEWAAREQ
jgi:hypothetical protein